jgi:hypothetical protein
MIIYLIGIPVGTPKYYNGEGGGASEEMPTNLLIPPVNHFLKFLLIGGARTHV